MRDTRLPARFELLLLAFAVNGCVREESAAAPAPVREEIEWNFVGARSIPTLRLWPSSASTPARLKRSVSTEKEEGRLRAHVDGSDPYFIWRIENPMAARLVTVDVEASEPGSLQLFWSSAACPTFRESCSLTEPISVGRQWVDFLLDRDTPIRELRLDLPDKVGATLWFHDIGVFDHAELSPRWAGRDGVELDVHSDGLDLVARNADPWMTVTTQGLDATPFQTVGLVLHATVPTAPQLYWDGACGHFDEACSVQLVPADAGELTHMADLQKVTTWRGAIRQLRLDPGVGAGDYTIDRVTLSGETTKAKRARR